MKVQRLLGASLMLAALALGTARADVLADIRARNKLICGMSSASAPWGYLDTKTQTIVGYEVDLCRMLAKSLGVEVELKDVSSAARVPEIVQGRIDLLAQLLNWSAERATQVDYSGAYIREPHYFMVLENSPLQTVQELAGKRIGVVAGSFLAPLIPPAVPTARVVEYDSQPSNFMALQQGKVAALAIRYSQAKALEFNGGANVRRIRALPGVLITATAGFGIRKGEAEWQSYLNTFLGNLETSGEGQALFDKWLGKDSPYKMERSFRFGEPLH